MPFFSIVATSTSDTPPRRHSSMNAASAGLDLAACIASGCSAATAQKVTPIIVSARVVKTFIRPSPIGLPRISPSVLRMSCGKANRTPRLLPIQFACITRTRSGHPVILSRLSRSSSA